MYIAYANDTRSRNRRQKTGVRFWSRFFTPETNIVTETDASFLAPVSAVGF